MHTYSTDNNLRPKVVAILGIVSYILVRISADFLSDLDVTLPLGIEVSVAMTGIVFTFVYLGFSKWAWDFLILRLLGIVKTPNLEGEWTGTLQSSFHSEQSNSPTEIEVHISQSWRRLSVELDAPNSSSRSLGATILSQQGKPELTYYYRSEPDWDAPDTMNMHYGTATLTYHEDNDGGDILQGMYYNGPDRDSHGQMRLEREENGQSWIQRRVC